MGPAANVLADETAPEQSFTRLPYEARVFRVPIDAYREAVKAIVLEVQAERGLDDEELAYELGCSKGTVKNARLKRGNVDAVTMLNLGALFGGEHRLRPILKLVNSSPAEIETVEQKRRRLIRALASLESEE